MAKTKPDKADYVTVIEPKIPGESGDTEVFANGKRYVVKRGVPVQVPPIVADILRNRDDMLAKSYAYDEANNGQN